MKNIYHHLYEKNLINRKQFQFLEAIHSNQLLSLHTELRLILYLGIMLLTSGIGYFAYQNLGEIGHLLSMVLLLIAIVAGFIFIYKFAKPYANTEVIVDQANFDYLLILVALLIISFFAYVMVYFDLVAMLINWTSFMSAAILFFMAYRYDNRALLSMAIAALAAAIGINVTPVDWVTGKLLASVDLYVISILLGISLIAAGQISKGKDIKRHFYFTYQNFGLVLFFIGCITAIFSSTHEIIYSLLTLFSAAYLSYYTWLKKEFLFFLYSNIAAYIGFTYLLIQSLPEELYIFLVYYFPGSTIGYIAFLIIKKAHFAHE